MRLPACLSATYGSPQPLTCTKKHFLRPPDPWPFHCTRGHGESLGRRSSPPFSISPPPHAAGTIVSPRFFPDPASDLPTHKEHWAVPRCQGNGPVARVNPKRVKNPSIGGRSGASDVHIDRRVALYRQTPPPPPLCAARSRDFLRDFPRRSPVDGDHSPSSILDISDSGGEFIVPCDN